MVLSNSLQKSSRLNIHTRGHKRRHKYIKWLAEMSDIVFSFSFFLISFHSTVFGQDFVFFSHVLAQIAHSLYNSLT